MLDKFKVMWKDKEDRRYIIRFSVIFIGVIAATIFYYLSANAPQQNVAKSFSAALGRLDTMKASSTFSATSDKDATQIFSEYFNTPSVKQFYAKLYTNYKFTTQTITVSESSATCDVDITLPNIKGAMADLFASGTGISGTQWTNLYKSDASAQVFDALSKAYDSGKLSLETVTVKLKMVSEDGGWKIVFDKDLLDQISGGAFTLLLH